MEARTTETAESSPPPLLVDLSALEPPFDWSALFGREAPVEMEIGSGKGAFLLEAARRWPERNFLGVEIAGRYLRRSLQRLERAGVRTVRLVRADARRILSVWTPPASLTRLHVYFPDPWPKRRHWKRRLFDAQFPELAARAVRPGGELLVATDHEGYAERIADVMGIHPGWCRIYWDPGPEEGIQTHYARKWTEAGRRIHWFRYRRVPGRVLPHAEGAC
jgi:tRNA (guanine-N7-)-methyltransferase